MDGIVRRDALSYFSKYMLVCVMLSSPGSDPQKKRVRTPLPWHVFTFEGDNNYMRPNGCAAITPHPGHEQRPAATVPRRGGGEWAHRHNNRIS